MDVSLSETARLLSHRPPFDVLAPEELGVVVAQTELEFYTAGAVILSEDGGPVTFLRVIHSGAVDIVHDERLLDLLGPGDTFGHAAMLSGLPPGFDARAAQDTLCYRIPAAVARPLLDRARARELQTGAYEPGHRPVAELIRAETVTCEPMASIREVARRMTRAGARSAIVDFHGRGFGIVTDRDIRTKIVAAGLPLTAPVAAVMTTPAFTVTPDRLGGEVLFELLERGIRHAPVVDLQGKLVGVVEDADLVAVAPRSWFGVRRAIARAMGIDALAAVAATVPELVLDLHAVSLRAGEVARVLSALVDAVIARALELTAAACEVSDAGLVWVAVASHARRELTPASRARGAVICTEVPPPGWVQSASSALRACGLPPEVVAQQSGRWLKEPLDELALEVLCERRVLWGTPREPLPVPEGPAKDRLLARLRERALACGIPTGFDGDGVLESDGRRSQWLDIHRAAIVPIVDIARWAGFAAGLQEGSTVERLRAGGHDGSLTDADARTLVDAFDLALELRVGHHLEQLAARCEPDDRLAPAALSPLTRDHLRDVFRAVTGVQRRLRG